MTDELMMMLATGVTNSGNGSRPNTESRRSAKMGVNSRRQMAAIYSTNKLAAIVNTGTNPMQYGTKSGLTTAIRCGI